MRVAFGRKRGKSNVDVVVSTRLNWRWGDKEERLLFEGRCKRCLLKKKMPEANMFFKEAVGMMEHLNKHIVDGHLVPPELVAAVADVVVRGKDAAKGGTFYESQLESDMNFTYNPRYEGRVREFGEGEEEFVEEEYDDEDGD